MKHRKLFLENRENEIGDEADQELEDLDDKFFKIDDSIEKWLYNYVLANKEEFMILSENSS